jgi:sigma-E factor negative regulatory protein RseB
MMTATSFALFESFFARRPVPAMTRQIVLRAALALLSMTALSAGAQTAVVPEGARTVNQWLARMHDASRQRAYTGTLVVSTGSAMSASRIWHVCDGKQQMERIETLTGAPRTTVRHNNDVITFAPDEKVAWVEKRESLGLFPELLRTPANQIPKFYGVRERGAERVAGYLADVVDIVPKDALRFGYRIWSEQRSGLVLKLQTVDEGGQVMEQLAYTELQMDAPVRMEKLAKLMNDTRGYQVHRPVLVKTSLDKQGWHLKDMVPGFLLISCHNREPEVSQRPHAAESVQCVYSDGLASVSVFFEPLSPERQVEEEPVVIGATHSMGRRVGPYAVTVLGEVPSATLGRFAQALERTR